MNTVIPYTGMQCIKIQVLGNRCSINHAFWPFLDYDFNAAPKLRKFGLNAANFILFAIFLDFKILTRFLFYLLNFNIKCLI